MSIESLIACTNSVFESQRKTGTRCSYRAFASAALFVFILNWSDYLIALLLTSRNWGTIPVYMASLSSSMTGQLYGAKAALGLIAAVPPIILGVAIQRHLVRGLTFGALKQ